MANPDHLEILKQGVKAWNTWREANRDEKPDLHGADLGNADLFRANLTYAHLRGADLRRADLRVANLSGANLTSTDLREATLREASLNEANLSDANLSGANLIYADLRGADLQRTWLTEADLRRANLRAANLRGAILTGAGLRKANLSGANLTSTDLLEANLTSTDLSGADLQRAKLRKANLSGAKLRGADLREADLAETSLISAELINADLSHCRIFGVSAWKVNLEGAVQSNLIITDLDEPEVTVDNLEVAQFIYLLLHNQKLRDVIHTIGEKAVLILGRFSEERAEILYAIRDRLREKGFLPIIFDFERATERDFTETVQILAGMSLFVITDITSPRSNPLELQATVPDYMVPFVPILQKGEAPFAMFVDLQRKYRWVMDVLVYDSKETLIEHLEEAVIKPALHKHDELLIQKNEALRIRNINEY